MLVTAVVCFALAELMGYPLLRGVAGAALGVVLAALLVTARRPRVTVTRAVYPDRVRRGQSAFAQLSVRNPGALAEEQLSRNHSERMSMAKPSEREN